MGAEPQVEGSRNFLPDHDLEKQKGSVSEVDDVSGSATPPRVDEDGKLNFATIMAVYVPGAAPLVFINSCFLV